MHQGWGHMFILYISCGYEFLVCFVITIMHIAEFFFVVALFNFRSAGASLRRYNEAALVQVWIIIVMSNVFY